MKRGDVVIIAAQGDHGKPRPAVIIQSDALDMADSVLVALFTSTIGDASFYRLTVEPTPSNGLKTTSQIMVDKILAYARLKCGPVIGHLETHHVQSLNSMLSVMIGLAD